MLFPDEVKTKQEASEDPQNMPKIIISILQLATSCGVFCFHFLVLIIPFAKINIIFFRNKFFLLCIFHKSVGRQSSHHRLANQKKKQAKQSQTTDSFINKDVLSMKIITSAKQNIVQGPQLLSEVCQQMLLKETVQQRGQE